MTRACCQPQAKVSRQISCEESWLRLLAWELTPIMQHLHHSKLHSSKPSISLLAYVLLAFHRVVLSFARSYGSLGTLTQHSCLQSKTAVAVPWYCPILRCSYLHHILQQLALLQTLWVS